jgi:hypothetical protein
VSSKSSGHSHHKKGILALGVVGGLVAAVASQAAEIRRYLKIRSM